MRELKLVNLGIVYIRVRMNMFPTDKKAESLLQQGNCMQYRTEVLNVGMSSD